MVYAGAHPISSEQIVLMIAKKRAGESADGYAQELKYLFYTAYLRAQEGNHETESIAIPLCHLTTV